MSGNQRNRPFLQTCVQKAPLILEHRKPPFLQKGSQLGGGFLGTFLQEGAQKGGGFWELWVFFHGVSLGGFLRVFMGQCGAYHGPLVVCIAGMGVP